LSNAVAEFFKTQELSEETPLKLRVDITEEGHMKTSIVLMSKTTTTLHRLYPSKLAKPDEMADMKKHTIILDWEPTAISTFTWLKTSQRDDYDVARKRMVKSFREAKSLIPANIEIILHNPRSEITEGSVTNVYFWRNEQWITPPVGPENGGLEGVVRRWALESGLCATIEKVMVGSVQNGEVVWISNGVRGFDPGIIRTRQAIIGSI
jgi:4-amino-4-deoxychorismate lyase